MNPLFAFLEGAFAPSHIIIVLIVGIILFGRRLPEVGRYLGKGIVEFKKGIKGLEDDVDVGGHTPRADQPMEAPRPPQRVAATAPKFEEGPAVPLPAPARSSAPKFDDVKTQANAPMDKEWERRAT
jgi:sec-independent protein translocase protein TatA